MATPVKKARQNEGNVDPAVLLKILGALFLLGVVVFLGCQTYQDPKLVRRTVRRVFSSAPPTCPIPATLSDTTPLRACVNSLTFDTVAAAGDEQRLLVRGPVGAGPACHGDPGHSCRYGPLAKIEPVIGADERSASALADGVIIARLFLREGEDSSYSKLNLAPGDTTYWWVKGQSETTAISRYLRISQGEVIDTSVGTIQIEQHPEEDYPMALARFIWDSTDEKTQGTCRPGGCCR